MPESVETAPPAAQAPAADPASTQPPQDTPPATSAPEAPAAPAADAGKGDAWDDPAKARAEIERLRRENGAARTTAKQQAADEAKQALAQEIGRALGLVQDDKQQADPAELAAQIGKLTDGNKALAIENAILKAAPKHGADVGALTDSRTFLAKAEQLDPTAADFGDKLSELIKSAVADNPKLKAAPVAGVSSADHAGGSGEGAVTKEQFDRMTVAQKSALYESDPATYKRLLGIN